MSDQTATWQTEGYARAWASEDVIADLLMLPRRMSVALVGAEREPSTVVDLGSGPGDYLGVFLEAFPSAGGVWIDGSEEMLEIARERLSRFGERVSYRLADLNQVDLSPISGVDVVVTSRLVHHFDLPSVRSVYRWAFDSLAPGGFFFNLDHYGAASDWEKRLRAIRKEFVAPRRSDLPPHRHDHPLLPLAQHLAILQEEGFGPPEVAWKAFHTALAATRKP